MYATDVLEKNVMAGKKPLLIDLFCGAGGASVGYAMAGFDVVGVDIDPQPHYPFQFIQGHVMEIFDELPLADAYAASPPCQIHSAMTNGRWQDRLRSHLNLIPDTRLLLQGTGKPYCIENVAGARRELINPTMLCGSMFGLESDYGNQIQRHRLFETNFAVPMPFACNHNQYSAMGVHGGGQHPKRRRRDMSISLGVDTPFGVAQQRVAMGIDWMTKKELNQSIPPAYTAYIGEHMMLNTILSFA